MGREHGGAKESSTAAPKPHTDQPQQRNHEAEEHARSDHRWAALATGPKRKRCSCERIQLLTPVTCSLCHTQPLSQRALMALLNPRLPIPITSHGIGTNPAWIP